MMVARRWREGKWGMFNSYRSSDETDKKALKMNGCTAM